MIDSDRHMDQILITAQTNLLVMSEEEQHGNRFYLHVLFKWFSNKGQFRDDIIGIYVTPKSC